MKKSEYLYGKNYDYAYIREHLTGNYRRIEWAKELLEELNEVPLMERDLRRINDVLEAIKFNQRIINEAWYPERDQIEEGDNK